MIELLNGTWMFEPPFSLMFVLVAIATIVMEVVVMAVVIAYVCDENTSLKPRDAKAIFLGIILGNVLSAIFGYVVLIL